MNSKIAGVGSYLPEKILTNDEIAEIVDTSDEWIYSRTGIKERRIAHDSESAKSMGVIAAKRALIDAKLVSSDIDLVIVATCSGAKVFPATACLIQHELEIPRCAAFDVQAACSGFLYALSVADSMIKNNLANNALVIGTEVMSRSINWDDRGTCILFGDGAGAFVLTKSSEEGIIYTDLQADGKYQDLLYADVPHNADRTHLDHYIHMQGNAVFKFAVNMLGEVALDAINKNNLKVDDIDWVVPHQANIRIIKAMADKMGIPMDKVVQTVEGHGNTSAASIPLALDTAIKRNQVKRGDLLLLEAFGGGLTWASALIRY